MSQAKQKSACVPESVLPTLQYFQKIHKETNYSIGHIQEETSVDRTVLLWSTPAAGLTSPLRPTLDIRWP